jgi:hypothetical protein
LIVPCPRTPSLLTLPITTTSTLTLLGSFVEISSLSAIVALSWSMQAEWRRR